MLKIPVLIVLCSIIALHSATEIFSAEEVELYVHSMMKHELDEEQNMIQDLSELKKNIEVGEATVQNSASGLSEEQKNEIHLSIIHMKMMVNDKEKDLANYQKRLESIKTMLRETIKGN